MNEFIGAELIRFDRLPGELAPCRTLIFGSNTVFPVVAADEVAARVTHRAIIQFAQRRKDIPAQALSIGVRRFRFVDAFVNAAAHVFGEAAKEQW